MAGTWAVEQIHPGALNVLIPVLLLLIAVYMLFTPSVGDRDRVPRLNRTIFYLFAGLSFGFYDGFFGPGVGSFWAFAFIVGLGFDLTRATGYTKVMNFTSNVVSLALFLVGGYVLYSVGLIMGVGQIVGARIGSRLVIHRGSKFVRPVFVTVVILTTLKLIYDRLW
jgi:uncharacterized membrane protein YfcA